MLPSDNIPCDLAYLNTHIFPRSFGDLLALIHRMTPMAVHKEHCRAYLQVEGPAQDGEPFIQRWVFHTLTDTGFYIEGQLVRGHHSEAEACDAFWRNFCVFVASPGRIVWRRLPEIDSRADSLTGDTLYRVSCRLALVPESIAMPVPEPADAS